MDDRTKNVFNTFRQFILQDEEMSKENMQGWEFPWKPHEYLIYLGINDVIEAD